jgi:hypothetical protein
MTANRSTHQSSHVVMASHYIGLYALLVGKKQYLSPYTGNTLGAILQYLVIDMLPVHRSSGIDAADLDTQSGNRS